jgi:hypothetical protein
LPLITASLITQKKKKKKGAYIPGLRARSNPGFDKASFAVCHLYNY